MKGQARNNKGKFLPTHGAHSHETERKYTDHRYREAKQLRAIIEGIADDLGGMDNLDSGQRLLLDTVRSKLRVILEISKYADGQPQIIKDGELLPCLGKSYLAYCNSIRLALVELYKSNSRGKRKVKTVGEIIAEYKG